MADVDLEDLIDRFVQEHSRNGLVQRGQGWKDSMAVTIGGSEIAALMGKNPYSTKYDVMFEKVAALSGGSTWDGGGEACWWGTLFEDVIGAYVEIDLGARVKGDEICIQAIAGHRTSPDGFLVGKFYRGEDGQLCVWTTDRTDTPPVAMILLLEFKCPLNRQFKPKMLVPPQYRPQVWSGLAVAPIAHKGLYVDAVFRKCAIGDLDDGPEYDKNYHTRDKQPWDGPIAWGLIGVYAPLLEAPRHVRLGWRSPAWEPTDPLPDAPDADASQAAWQIHTTYFGTRLKDQKNTRELVDLGDMEKKLFNRTLGLINRKLFPVLRTEPCFEDGRGRDLQTSAGLLGTLEMLRAKTPKNHWLLAILPWKLFEVVYIPVDRRPDFLDEVMPLIREVHQTVAEALATEDPQGFIKAKRLREVGPPKLSKFAADEDAIQDLFDSVAAHSDHKT